MIKINERAKVHYFSVTTYKKHTILTKKVKENHDALISLFLS